MMLSKFLLWGGFALIVIGLSSCTLGCAGSIGP